MQTKSSHRALKWTLFMGIAASLASACVVSTGDGDNDDVDINGGDGGTNNNTSGTKNTGGTKAGGNTGGSSAGTSTAGTTSGGGEGGTDGGAANPDYPGVCDSSLKTPSMLDDAACESSDDDNPCGACLKEKCCDVFKACYGKEPTSACGYGTSPATLETDRGQFDCIVACYERDNDGVTAESVILEGCQEECLNQCADTDDFINDDTNDMMNCALNGEDGKMTGDDDCHDVCFPPPAAP